VVFGGEVKFPKCCNPVRSVTSDSGTAALLPLLIQRRGRGRAGGNENRAEVSAGGDGTDSDELGMDAESREAASQTSCGQGFVSRTGTASPGTVRERTKGRNQGTREKTVSAGRGEDGTDVSQEEGFGRWGGGVVKRRAGGRRGGRSHLSRWYGGWFGVEGVESFKDILRSVAADDLGDGKQWPPIVAQTVEGLGR
jgi:hypothetical protein